MKKMTTFRFLTKDISVIITPFPCLIELASGGMIAVSENALPVTPVVCDRGWKTEFVLVINEAASPEMMHIHSGIFGLYLEILANIQRKDSKIDLEEHSIRNHAWEYGRLAERIIGNIKELDEGLYEKALGCKEES